MSAPNKLIDFAPIRFVFLDRDGVINRKPPEGEYITQPSQLELLPGAAGAIARLNRSGRKVIVVTNQRGIALGLMTEAQLATIHAHLRAQLAFAGATLDAIYHCPHDRDECNCRKPQTGMIDAAFRNFPEARPENSLLIGDSLSDIECGRRAGIPTILIEGDAQHRKPGFEAAMAIADEVSASLAEAIAI
jgi:D-glycero-D-manno-heptose 1,7-bisphosphate phosphatase